MLTLDVDGRLHFVFSDPTPDERALIFRAPVSLVGARRLECAGAEEYGMLAHIGANDCLSSMRNEVEANT